MGFPAPEVGYTSATTGKGDHEVHKGHVVALKKILKDNHLHIYPKPITGLTNSVVSEIKNFLLHPSPR
jgi:hypothetical protein